MDFKTDLQLQLKAFGIACTERQLEQFTVYYEELIETNKYLNLTAITDPHEVAVKHMIDSLSCYDRKYFPAGARILDLGTGAGFPGIPLAIYNSSLRITLFDSLQKRLRFLESTAVKLGLTLYPAKTREDNAAERTETSRTDKFAVDQADKAAVDQADKAAAGQTDKASVEGAPGGVCTLHGRAEDCAHDPDYREQFDAVTSRAVARLPVLLEWGLPYVKKGGYMAALKGAAYEEEIQEAKRALSLLGGSIAEVRPVKLPGIEDKRAVIYIAKNKHTPSAYPRKPKEIKDRPL